MARKRMFSRDVIGTEWFTDMPATAQMLYVHLSMDADDDGFVVNTKTAVINSHASKDDLSILLAKHYIIKVEEGLYLVKHWRQNNYIQKDRKKQSDYADRLSMFGVKEDGSYTLKSNGGNYGEIGEKQPGRKPLEGARLARYEAKKSSDLPSCFDYKIRHAFDGKQCPVCGATMREAIAYSSPTIQHNTPISLGGKHEIDNISVICRHCNTSLQNRQITGPLNNAEVQRIWSQIGNVSGMDTQNRLEENSVGIDIVEGSLEENNLERIYEQPKAHAYAYTKAQIEASPMVAMECLEMRRRMDRGEDVSEEWRNTLTEFADAIQKFKDGLPFRL